MKNGNRCGVPTDRTGEPCRLRAGLGTDHPGTGPCYRHDDDFSRLCGARTRAGGRCRQPAGHATSHAGIGACRRHGGNLPSHVAHAAKIEAETHLRRIGQPFEIAPEKALLLAVEMSAGHLRRLRFEINQAENGSREERTLLAAEALERDRFARHSKAAVDAGASNLVKKATEEAARSALRTVEAVLDRLGLTDSQRERVPELIDEALGLPAQKTITPG